MNTKSDGYKKGGCGNIIFSTSRKLFHFPAIMMREFFSAAGEKSRIVTNDAKLPQIEGIAEHFGTFESAAQDLADCDSIRSICFHHNGERYFEQFVRNINQVFSEFPTKQKLISFYPDGFGNAMHGISFAEKLTGVFPDEVTIDHYLSFGFTHGTTAKLAAGRPIQPLDFSILTDFFDRSETIQKHCNLKELSGLSLDECVLVPYRPWCTTAFHNGVYDFGDTKELAVLYKNLIERAQQEHGRKVKVIFRGDERFGVESDLVRELLSRHFDVINLASLYSQELTLEPLIYFLIKTGVVRKMSMICLDSTSFQVPAFLVRNMGPDRLVGYMGAPMAELDGMTGGREFMNRKLRRKIADFRQRYKAFEADGIIASVIDLDDTFFQVRTN